MSIVIFDTETTSLNKPFCYNVGYIIADNGFNILLKKEYVVEQIWHNRPLFSSAYYADKRPIYVSLMKAKKAELKKFGYVCQDMIRDFKKFNVTLAYAYNSNFDEKVFEFCCDWFNCNNPFDNIPIFDIRGNFHSIVDSKYKAFCVLNNLLTESGCYSSTAENVYRFIKNDLDFIESHTALDDSEIELEILKYTVEQGCNLYQQYCALNSLGSPNVEKILQISHRNKIYQFPFFKMRFNKKENIINLE